MPASAGAAIALVMPGTTSKRHAGRSQRERFLAAPPQHERIAALQADDAAPAPGGANHQRVDLVLCQRVAAGALADEEPLRVPRVAQDLARR